MDIVIDSGSSKSSWAFIYSNEDVKILELSGYNPAIHASIDDNTLDTITHLTHNKIINNVYFYGAGVTEKTKSKVIEKLSFLTPLGKFEIESDMLCAARSVCGVDTGVVGILGTGSNACYYNGHEYYIAVPSLGYILSDEGGGVHLGKELLKAYFYGLMPEYETRIFSQNYPIEKNELIKYIYQMHAGSGFIAKFARFLGDVKTSWTEELISKVFDEFIDTRIMVYEDHLSKQIHFVGSIAFEHQSILKKCLEDKNLRMGKIVKRPIEGCIDYHKKVN